ncbi:MAG: hypothetical protein RL354_2435 [Planctomycetota bacterium]
MPRPVHLLHDAAALARMLALESPCCAQIAMSTEGAPSAWGAFLDANPLGGTWIADAELPARRIVSHSGTLADTSFGDDPRTWMKPGHERFKSFCDEVEPALRAHGRTLCFRPHHRHVLGDVHASVKLLRDRAGGPFEILLSPGDLLAPSMLGQAEDHLVRMFAHLGPIAAGVLLFDVAATAESAETGLLQHRRLGEGLLPTPLVSSLLAEHVPAETPLILLPGALDAQRSLLGL